MLTVFFTKALSGLQRPETLPQELGLMLLSAPRPTLSEYHVHVFSTRPLLFHIELAPLAKNAAFLVRPWECQKHVGG